MRKLTEQDLASIAGSVIEGYHIETVRVKNGSFTDSDHYGIILGKNILGHYVTWEFHLLDDDSVSVYWGHYFMENREAAARDFDTRDQGSSHRQKFNVIITETQKRTIEVDADGQHKTEKVMSDGWHSGEYIFDAGDFADVDFRVIPMVGE